MNSQTINSKKPIETQSLLDKDLLSSVYEHLKQSDIVGLEKLLKENTYLIELEEFGATFNKTLLHYAAHKGNIEMCKLLCSLGANINSSVNGDTPLCEASTVGNLDTVKLLIENGATVDGVFSTITSPLMCAIIFGHNEIAEYLINKGADINRIHLNLHQTPLDLSVIWGNTKIEKILCDRKAKTTLQKTDWSKEFGGSIIQYVDDNAGTVLPVLFTPIVKNTVNVTQRIAIINKEKNKYLFTVGLFAIHKPMIELFIVLPASWNMHDKSPENMFPCMLLIALSELIVNGKTIQEGDFISCNMPELSELKWAADIEGFWVCDYTWNKNEPQSSETDDDKVNLFTLIPEKKMKTKKKPTFDAEKCRKATWNKICLNLT